MIHTQLWQTIEVLVTSEDTHSPEVRIILATCLFSVDFVKGYWIIYTNNPRRWLSLRAKMLECTNNIMLKNTHYVFLGYFWNVDNICAREMWSLFIKGYTRVLNDFCDQWTKQSNFKEHLIEHQMIHTQLWQTIEVLVVRLCSCTAKFNCGAK